MTDSDDSAPLPGAQPPENHTGIKRTKPDPDGAAGGPSAVTSSMRHAWGEMGIVRGSRTLLKMNQFGGFDCPGCAWPDPDDRRSFVEFCENGAKAIAEEATRKTIGPEFFAKHSIAELLGWSDHKLGKAGRLTHPLIRRSGATHYEEISWDDAFATIARHLQALDSPNEAVFYTSGRTSNEAAFLWQLLARQFGTNNLPDCSNMCHESSGKGLTEVIGVGKGTVSLADFAAADTIFVVGQNPGTNHPRMLSTLQEAARRGARIASINPLRETGLVRFRHPQEVRGWVGSGTPLAQTFVPVRINGDVALLTAVAKAVLEANALDREFIAEHTVGFDAFADHLRAADWQELLDAAGVTREHVDDLAQLAITAKGLIICWAMGLTQHENAVANIQCIVNLLLMRGMLGKPGAGACPVRGHSNVQGDRTVGIVPTAPKWSDALGREFHFTAPTEPGLDTVHTIKAMADGTAKVFVGMGGNFLSATPDTEFTARAIQRSTLTACISTKLNRGHLITGDEALILPCLARSEHDRQSGGLQVVSVENSMGIVHTSKGHLKPASEHLRSEPAIVAGLAQAVLGESSTVPWAELVADYDRIRDRIEAVIPGFTDYNRRVREPAGFYLPNPVRDSRTWNTPAGKAHFTVHEVPRHELADGQLLMMTIRSHDQYNTTIYGLDDRYRGVKNERRVIFLHPDDIAARGLSDGQAVDITSHWQNETRIARNFLIVSYEIPPGCAATYFPEANVLVPLDQMARKSHTPASKSVVISLAPATT